MIRNLFWWPVTVVGTLVRLLFWPVLVGFVVYFLVPHSWFLLIACLLGLYVLVVVRVWLRIVRGTVQSILTGRGPTGTSGRSRSASRRRSR